MKPPRETPEFLSTGYKVFVGATVGFFFGMAAHGYQHRHDSEYAFLQGMVTSLVLSKCPEDLLTPDVIGEAFAHVKDLKPQALRTLTCDEVRHWVPASPTQPKE